MQSVKLRFIECVFNWLIARYCVFACFGTCEQCATFGFIKLLSNAFRHNTRRFNAENDTKRVKRLKEATNRGILHPAANPELFAAAVREARNSRTPEPKAPKRQRVCPPLYVLLTRCVMTPASTTVRPYRKHES